jgi:hypothetical protein
MEKYKLRDQFERELGLHRADVDRKTKSHPYKDDYLNQQWFGYQKGYESALSSLKKLHNELEDVNEN